MKSPTIQRDSDHQVTLGDILHNSEEIDYISSVPREILTKIAVYLPDTDLQTLSRVSRTLRIVATDKVLWNRYIFMDRNPKLLEMALLKPQRPTRQSLHSLAILPFAQNGFITAAHVRQVEARIKVARQIVMSFVDRKLKTRPTLQELQEKNILPVEIQVISNVKSVKSSPPPRVCSPSLIKNAVMLKEAFKRDSLKRRMEGRHGLDSLRDECHLKSYPNVKKSKHLTQLRTEIEIQHVVKSARLCQTSPRLAPKLDLSDPNAMDVLERLLFEKLFMETRGTTVVKPSPLIEERLAYFETAIRQYAPPPPPVPKVSALGLIRT